jgi:mono/diheme cytochrome c family protein
MNRREFPSGTPANDARLKDTIKMGRAMMPAFSNTLTDEQVNAIVQYVHTL